MFQICTTVVWIRIRLRGPDPAESATPIAYLLEDPRQVAALAGGAPAGDGAGGAALVLLALGGQGDGAHMLSEGGRLLQLQQADVVGDGPAVVLLVQVDRFDGNVLLVGVHGVEVVAAHAHTQVPRRHPVGAKMEKI